MNYANKKKTFLNDTNSRLNDKIIGEHLLQTINKIFFAEEIYGI